MPSSIPPFRFWRFFFSLKGRVSRRAIWWFVLPVEAATDIIMYGWRHLRPVAQGTSIDDAIVYASVIGLIKLMFLWPVFAVLVKRLHDCNVTGLIALPRFLPFVAIIGTAIGVLYIRGIDMLYVGSYINLGATIYLGLLILVLAFLPGSKGANRFGPHPRQSLTTSDVF